MFSDQLGICYENNISGKVIFLLFFLIFKNVKEKEESITW